MSGGLTKPANETNRASLPSVVRRCAKRSAVRMLSRSCHAGTAFLSASGRSGSLHRGTTFVHERTCKSVHAGMLFAALVNFNKARISSMNLDALDADVLSAILKAITSSRDVRPLFALLSVCKRLSALVQAVLSEQTIEYRILALVQGQVPDEIVCFVERQAARAALRNALPEGSLSLLIDYVNFFIDGRLASPQQVGVLAAPEATASTASTAPTTAPTLHHDPICTAAVTPQVWVLTTAPEGTDPENETAFSLRGLDRVPIARATCRTLRDGTQGAHLSDSSLDFDIDLCPPP